MFKNESRVLQEWIEHCIYHGVDHLYMINDGSSDKFLDILKPYISSGYVTLFDSSELPRIPSRQALIYNLFLIHECRYSKWMAVLDMDEFIYSPLEINLKKILKNYDDFSQIFLPWVFFSSNGLEKQPKSVVKGFTKKIRNSDFGKHSNFKSIIKCSKIYCFFIHNHFVKGATEEIDVFSHNPRLIINHYYVQSREYWKEKKIPSGSSNHAKRHINRGWDLFEKFDVGDIEDLRLYEQNKQLIKKLEDESNKINKI